VRGWLSYADTDPARSGISSTRVLLNGIVIAAATGHRKGANQVGAQVGHESELPAARKAFRFGWNTIEIKVIKGVQDANGIPPRCGISFGLRASFVADMELGESKQSARLALVPRYQRFEPGSSASAQITATVRNDGPASSIAGKLVVSVESNLTPRGVALKGAGKLERCIRGELNKWLYSYECPYTNWHPGETGTLTVTVSGVVTEAVNYGEQSISINFSLGGAGHLGTPPGGIDYIPYKLVACGPTASSDGCKSPRGWADSSP
jgi:hypothetical protein